MYCTNCGQELPEGALFCPTCGYRQGVKSPPSKVSRRTSITIAAVILGVGGLIELAGGGLVVVAGASLSIVPILGPMALLLGFLILLFGVVDMVAAEQLWHSKRSGGTLGIASLLLGTVIGAILFGPLAILDVFITILVLACIAAGWESLR